MRTLTQKQKLWLLVGLNVGVLAVAIIYVALFRYASALELPWFDCRVRDALGIYCPSCGGSRSINALLGFDPLGALLYFPPIPLAAVLLGALDVRVALDLLTRSSRFTARYRWQVWLSVPCLMLIVFLLRLVLWLGFGIDALGDLS